MQVFDMVFSDWKSFGRGTDLAKITIWRKFTNKISNNLFFLSITRYYHLPEYIPSLNVKINHIQAFEIVFRCWNSSGRGTDFEMWQIEEN